MRRIILSLVFLTAAGLFLVAQLSLSWAQSDELKLNQTSGARGPSESHVQMRPILAPVKRRASSKSVSNIPVTPVLTVISKDQVGHVCKLGPRVSDALIIAWYAHPMTLAYIFDPVSNERVSRMSKSPEEKSEDQRLIAAINEALEFELISDILIIKGALQMGDGTIAKLPFLNILGCAELESNVDASEEEKAK
jgi:hypothetical protein